jgi:hypothetical protein
MFLYVPFGLSVRLCFLSVCMHAYVGGCLGLRARWWRQDGLARVLSVRTCLVACAAQEVTRTMLERPRNHAAQVAKLEAAAREQYPFWRTLLGEGHNLVFYGFGSKRAAAAVSARARAHAGV